MRVLSVLSARLSLIPKNKRSLIPLSANEYWPPYQLGRAFACYKSLYSPFLLPLSCLSVKYELSKNINKKKLFVFIKKQ